MPARLTALLTAAVLALALLLPPLARAQNASQQLAADSVLETIKKRGAIKIGMSTFVPWAMRDKNGELIGYEVDVAKRLAEDMKVKEMCIRDRVITAFPAHPAAGDQFAVAPLAMLDLDRLLRQ